MTHKYRYVLGLVILGTLLMPLIMLRPPVTSAQTDQTNFDNQISANLTAMFQQGKQIFRFDTFGDEAFWGDTLKLHRAIVGQRLGGVGPGVSPKKALEVGLKVDAEALPQNL